MPLFQRGYEKFLVHEWVKNGNLDTWMTSCKPLISQALPCVYLGTVKLRPNDTWNEIYPHIRRRKYTFWYSRPQTRCLGHRQEIQWSLLNPSWGPSLTVARYMILRLFYINVLQVAPHVSRLPFLPIRVRGTFSYLLAMKWIISIPMYH